jgi:hypothetical protein
MASEIAGLVWPPEALPRGLRISPASSNPTAAPTITSSMWICGIALEMGDGPITHLTMLTTPKSRTAVSANSNALSRTSRVNGVDAGIFDRFTESCICVAASRSGVRRQNNRSLDSKVPNPPRSSGALHQPRPAYRCAAKSPGMLQHCLEGVPRPAYNPHIL